MDAKFAALDDCICRDLKGEPQGHRKHSAFLLSKANTISIN